MRPARLLCVLAVVAGLGVAATCTPYDPSLPDKPFLCNDEEPRCPDGYACVAEPSGAQVCSKDGASSDASLAPDAGP